MFLHRRKEKIRQPIVCWAFMLCLLCRNHIRFAAGRTRASCLGAGIMYECQLVWLRNQIRIPAGLTQESNTHTSWFDSCIICMPVVWLSYHIHIPAGLTRVSYTHTSWFDSGIIYTYQLVWLGYHIRIPAGLTRVSYTHSSWFDPGIRYPASIVGHRYF